MVLIFVEKFYILQKLEIQVLMYIYMYCVFSFQSYALKIFGNLPLTERQPFWQVMIQYIYIYHLYIVWLDFEREKILFQSQNVFYLLKIAVYNVNVFSWNYRVYTGNKNHAFSLHAILYTCNIRRIKIRCFMIKFQYKKHSSKEM